MSPLQSKYPRFDIDDRPFSQQFVEKIWANGYADHDRVALINAHKPSDRVTYRQLYLRINSLARFLRRVGFGRRSVACIVSTNCWQYIVAFGGVALAGGALSGVSSSFVEYEIMRQIEDCGASLVFVGESLLPLVQRAVRKCSTVKTIVVIAEDEKKKFDDRHVYNFAETIRDDRAFETRVATDVRKDPILIPYSSGTTGAPKGVLLSHQNLSFTLTALTIAFDHAYPKIDPGASELKNEHLLILMPLFHMYGCIVTIHTLMSGCTGILMRGFEPDLFCASIQQYKVRLLMIVPPIALFMAKSPVVDKYDLSSLKLLMSGAAPLGKDLIVEVASHFFHVADDNADLANCGTLLSLTEQKIVDAESGVECGVGERGEICIRGPGIMLGYLKRPKETAAMIDKDGFLHTGDIGYVDQRGLLYIVDRIKELIKVKGLQVAPAELEDLLLSHPLVADCAVIGVPDSRAGELPKAFIVRVNESLTEKQVYDYVADHLAKYKRLDGGVEFVKLIPKSPAGKILRRNLRQPLAAKL